MELVDLPHSDHGPRNAMPLILLHGFPFDHRMWSPQKSALEAAGHRVIVPDLRGAGKAPLGKPGATMREYAGDVLRLADRAGLRRFVLAGFSMGGYVALEVARQASDRLHGLVLVDSRAEPDSDEARAGRAATAEKVRASGLQVVVDAMLPKMFTKAAPARMVDEARDVMLSQRPEGAIGALLAMGSRADSRPMLPSLRVPTLAIVGAEDAITPPEAAKTLASLVPGGRHVVIPGAAHLSPLEKAEDVSALMLGWLKEHP